MERGRKGDWTAAAALSTGAGSSKYLLPALHFEGVEESVSDHQLAVLFGNVAEISWMRVSRDTTGNRCFGHGDVAFCNMDDATRALNELNFTRLNGQKISMTYAIQNPFIRTNLDAKIFIKIARDPSRKSKGYGFVQFLEEKAAKDAIDNLNDRLISGKNVYVGPFQCRSYVSPFQCMLEREISATKTTFNNVFVKNLSESTMNDDLKKVFGEYGTITSAVVMREEDGKSKCFGFVNFENAADAAQSIEDLNGKKFDGKEWYVGKAQKKAERELELKGRFEQSMKESADKYQVMNLYLKNLHCSIDDDKLREMFSGFGTITSCKVMRDPNGASKGSGFVAFSTFEEASGALAEMAGKMVDGKRLYVARAQPKEDRKAMLQAQFSPSVAQCNPSYHPHAPHLGGQISYGQDPPALIPMQLQLIPRTRPGGASVPNSFVPLVPQSQHALHSGGRHTDTGPAVQQQMFPWALFYGYPPGGCNIPVLGVTGGMMQMREAGISQPIPIEALSPALG